MVVFLDILLCINLHFGKLFLFYNQLVIFLLMSAQNIICKGLGMANSHEKSYLQDEERYCFFDGLHQKSV